MCRKKRVFLAGASGAIGRLLCQLLIKNGYEVIGTTRSVEKVKMLQTLGVEPVVIDVFDAQKLEEVVINAKPDIVIHQLTDLPAGLDPAKMEAALVRNARLREEGTKNLVNASLKAGAKKMIAQSIAFVYEPGALPHTEESPLLNFKDPTYGETSRALASLEEQVLNASFAGIVLRYGLLFGPGTGFDSAIDALPCVHVEAAAHAALLAIKCKEKGIYNIAIKDDRLSTTKATSVLKWNANFRIG